VLTRRSNIPLLAVGSRSAPARSVLLHPFLIATFAAAIPLAVITVWIALAIGGQGVVDRVRDVGEMAAGAAAVTSCALMARRSSWRTRRAWALLAVSAGSALIGEIGELIYTVMLGGVAPLPSFADIGVLGAIPFAVAGLESFPTATGSYASRRRWVLDAAMVALSLLFVSWAFGLDQIYKHAATPLAGWTAIAYPVGDIVVATALVVALRQSLPEQRARVVLVVAGLAVIAFFDSTRALLAANNSSANALLSGASMYGYTMVALAPLYPPNSAARPEMEITLWRMLLPYLGVIAVVLTALYRVLTHQNIDPLVALPAAGLLVVLVASQVQGYVDWLELLTKSRQAEAMVKERETMLNNLISHAPQGVARITRDRRITDINPRMLDILQAPASEVVGARLDAYLSPDDVESVFGQFTTAGQAPDDTVEFESQARCRSTEVWLHWSATPIRKADGRIDYFLAIFEDVTARREADETAGANLEQLEKLNRLKSEFVSMVSHEFRTALVGIQGFSELIRDEQMEMGEVKNLAQDINADAERLNRMITEMLDLDRLEARKVQLNLRPVALDELLLEAVERARLSTTKHSIVVDLHPDPPAVMGDADRITQVLSNLLSNAIKYSPDGGQVTVGTRLVDNSVEVAIKDQGLGIPPEFIGRLFGRYERYEDKHAGKIIGSGLGLAITRQIVEMHGGKIFVDSAVGSGSEFRFTLPIQARAAPPGPAIQ
jgi:PAS domain S-box-containing protein